jgi:NAD(P)-dependent dehydrogenase (short-subunit alcohol dehydrogenase family)
MKLSGNTTFIAGATSGIGRGLAERFADAGNNVIIAGRRQHLADEIVAGHDNIEGLVLDVRRPTSDLRPHGRRRAAQRKACPELPLRRSGRSRRAKQA